MKKVAGGLTSEAAEKSTADKSQEWSNVETLLILCQPNPQLGHNALETRIHVTNYLHIKYILRSVKYQVT